MIQTILVHMAVWMPLGLGLLSLLLKRLTPRQVNICHICVLTLSALCVWGAVLSGAGDDMVILPLTETLQLEFRLDGAGRIFACMSATLWVPTAVYATEYLKHETAYVKPFWAFFTASFGVTMGIAFAGNMLTLYLFYEMLTLCTIPLVLHYHREKDFRATTRYMIFSFGGAALALSAVVFLILQHADKFSLGGHIAPESAGAQTLILFLFGFFGFGVKSAVFPAHSWLPAASVAPTPVTALLHAVAVVKAGAFAVIRLIYYSFGYECLSGTWAQYTVMGFAAFTIVYGSVQALRQQHFKRRLAYSTVSNLSYILLAATMMTPAGLVAAFAHILVHSVTKITGFFAAGAVLHNTGREYLEDMNGIGRKMPWTFACFTVTALSLTGIPLFGGFTSKWMIGTAAVENGSVMAYIGLGALLLSALLTGIYMFTIVIRAYFPKNGELSAGLEDVHDVSPRMIVPMLLGCAAMVAFGLLAGPFVRCLWEVLP